MSVRVMDKEIKHFYYDEKEWRKQIIKWKSRFYLNEIEDLESNYNDFFHSVYSISDFNSYQEIIGFLRSNKNKSDLFLSLHENICISLDFLNKNDLENSFFYADKAKIIFDNYDGLRVDFFHDFYVKVKVLYDLSKLNTVKEKVNYLNFSFYERSHNSIYSTDIFGLKILLSELVKDDSNLYARKLKPIIDSIYEKTKKWKIDFVSSHRDDLLKIKYVEGVSNDIKKLSLIIAGNESFSFHNISGVFWLVLFKILSLGLRIESAYIAREISKCFFIGNKERFYKKNNPMYLYSLRAYSEENLKEFDLNGFTNKNYSIAQSYSKLYQGEKNSFIYDYQDIINEKDLMFSKYIKNKSVAVVAPVDTGLMNGKEIDSYDVVIRMNSLRSNRFNKDNFGKKQNVVYYIPKAINNQFDDVFEIKDSFDFICYQGFEGHKNRDRLFHDAKFRQSYILHFKRANNIFFSGNPNAAQRIILDIIGFKPKSIKLFNMNLWIENIPNDAYFYKQSFSPVNLICHDVFSNFAFTKRMYELNYIEVDKVLEDVLSLSLDEYASILNDRYGK